MIIKIDKKYLEWIIDILNEIIQQFKNAGIIPDNVNYLKQRLTYQKRRSYIIKIVRDAETEYVKLHINFIMVKDFLTIIKNNLDILISILVGVKSFLNIFNNKDNRIVKDMRVFGDIWKDKPFYCIFNYPNDDNKFFNGTKFIASTFDRNEWEVVYVECGTPKDNKKRSKIENDIKRSLANELQVYVNKKMMPGGEAFETLEQAKYRLMNSDPGITIPQDEFRGGDK